MSDDIFASKYLDISSFFRNRNKYPNPYDFVIPYSFPNKGSTSLGFFDPVLESSPYTGSPTLQPGELVTGGSSSVTSSPESHLSLSSTTTDIILDSNETPIDNFYINSTLQLFSEFRTIISYNGTTKLCKVSNPFSSAPPPGTVYFIRFQKTYFDSDIVPYRINSQTRTVDQLNLITAAPSPTKDFYSESYIRFKNGPHVGETALITAYEPFGLVTSWDQRVNQGSNTFLSTSEENVFRFSSQNSGSLNKVQIRLTSFGSRQIRIRIIDINSVQLYSNDFPVSDNFSQTDTSFSFVPSSVLSSGTTYLLTLQDVSPGGDSSGFINIFGIVPSTQFQTSSSVFPKTEISLTGSSSVTWSQPSSLGESTYLNTLSEVGFRIVPETTSGASNIVFSLISFESVSVGRTIRLRIREGEGLTGLIQFTKVFIIPNTNLTTPEEYYLDVPLVALTAGLSYTITLIDETVGGTSTGFINLFGIVSNSSFISYNTSFYPKIFVKNRFGQSDKLSDNLSQLNSMQGNSVALSADATTMAVGSPGIESVYIFIRINTVWTIQQILQGSGIAGPKFGSSVSISDDGSTVAVGAPNDDASKGSVWMFTRTSGVWTQQGPKLVGFGDSIVDNQGKSVALSSDGSTLAFGGPSFGSDTGAVWVFTRTSGVWTQQQGPIVDFGYISWKQGYSVALSSTGDTLAVGSPAFSVGIGGVLIYTRSLGVWSPQSVLIPAIVGGSFIRAGFSCSLSSNGNTCVFGAPDEINGVTVWVYNRIGVNWSVEVAFGDPILNRGWSTSISGDGNILLAGAIAGDGGSGSVSLYSYSRGGTSNWAGYILSPDTPSEEFGYSVSISRDKSFIAVGSPTDNSLRGATYIFSQLNLYSQPSSPSVVSRVSTSSEQGFQFTPSTSGLFSEVSLNLSSFDSLLPSRTLEIKIRQGIGGLQLYSDTFFVSNTERSVKTFPIPLSLELISGDLYTLTIRDDDVSAGSSGNMFVYGIEPSPPFESYNISTYPKLTISSVSIPSSFVQPLSPTISTDISTITDYGFYFSPFFSGETKQIILPLTAFGTTGERTLRVEIKDGSGLSGTSLYNTDVIVPTTRTRSNFVLDMSSSGILEKEKPYTLLIRDVTIGGMSTGNVTLYGINSISPFNSFNTPIYPSIRITISSFIITISPPKSIDGFLPIITSTLLTSGPNNSVEFNSQALENATTLFQNGNHSHNTQYYKIGLKYLVLPNQILDVSNGGRISDYPYVYVQIYNDGDRGSLNVIESNNPNSSFACFKCPIDRSLYDIPSSFITLKTRNNDQVIKFRANQNIRITITLPDGAIISTSRDDNLSPLFPNPLLQTNALFSLLAVDINDYKLHRV